MFGTRVTTTRAIPQNETKPWGKGAIGPQDETTHAGDICCTLTVKKCVHLKIAKFIHLTLLISVIHSFSPKIWWKPIRFTTSDRYPSTRGGSKFPLILLSFEESSSGSWRKVVRVLDLCMGLSKHRGHLNKCGYIYIYICVYIYMHIYICIYIYMHMHTYIYIYVFNIWLFEFSLSALFSRLSTKTWTSIVMQQFVWSKWFSQVCAEPQNSGTSQSSG